MKIRTDFVTNSSSSSFIFRGKQSKKTTDDDIMFGAEPMHDCNYADVIEVFTWYSDDIYEIAIQGLDNYLQSGRKISSREERITKIAGGTLDNDAIKRMAGLVIMEFYSRSCHFYDEWGYPQDYKSNSHIFSNSVLEDVLWPAVFSDYVYYSNDVLFEFITDYTMQLKDLLKEYIGLNVGGVLEKILGECYMLFGYNIIFESDKEIMAIPDCIFACSHMG